MADSGWSLLQSFGASSGQLEGQTALITGAARGIGEHLALLMGRLGANVVIADILPRGQIVADVIAADGGAATFLCRDLGNPAETDRLILDALGAYGAVDILVNGAMQFVVAPVVDTSPEDWDRFFDINVRAAFLIIRQLLPGMMDRQRGVIVNMIAPEGGPLLSAYNATKCALRSLALSVAREVGDGAGIASFAFLPGTVDTPAVRDVLQPAICARFGISPDEAETTVLAQNPGYPGLVPVAHCAAALAFCILHAREYHGQVAEPFEPLSRFGVIEIPTPDQIAADALIGELTEESLPLHVVQFQNRILEQNRKLEERIALRTEEIRRLMRERAEFFDSLSHELRTPLAVIMSQGDLLMSGAPNAGAGAAPRAGRVVKDSAAQVLRVVNDILELARSEVGSLDLDLAPVHLDRLAAELSPTIEGLTSAADLVLNVDVPADLPAALADQGRLREVILNLTDNAVKYTPPGGRIGLTARVVEGQVEFSVTDTGVGIPADVGERIFEPFYRVPGTTAQRGQSSSGLGLPMSKRLVDAHGGRLWYTSIPGGGATFSFTLPIADE